MYSSPGFDKFYALQASIDPTTIQQDYELLNLEPSIIENDIEYQPTNSKDIQTNNEYTMRTHKILEGSNKSNITSHQILPQPTLSTNSQRLLQYHYRYKHAPFQHLRTMAKQNILPKELAKCDIPPCIYCIYGRATRRPWRNKSPPNKNSSLHALKPGQCISVDMLTSPNPGFIAQIVGRLTRRRYNHSTIFVDNYSGLSYVYHQETANASETIKGKKAFEAFANKHGVTIKQYHSDNGIFKSQEWQEHCKQMHQTLTFAGVNAHHQNGRAERRIRLLQDVARTQLIHASHHWPTVHITPLWPYALLCANHAINNTPNMQNNQRMTPLQLFSSTTVHSNPKDQQPFACPIYVLKSELQQQKPFHKWAARSKNGIYLGPSPQHARTIALVLDTTTGLVSPQFHVMFDPTYSTSKHNKTPNAWATKAGFTHRETKLKPGSHHDNVITSTNKRKMEDLTYPIQNSKSLKSDNKRDAYITPVIATKEAAQAPVIATKEAAQAPVIATKAAAKAKYTISVTPVSKIKQRAQRGRSSSTPRTQIMSNNKNKTNDKNNIVSKQLTKIKLAYAAEICSNPEGDEHQGFIFDLQAMYPEHDIIYAMKSSTDPDSLYYHEAIQTPDKVKFLQAMDKEIEANISKNNITLIHKSDLPKNAVLLPAVWQLRRKRNLLTNEIKRYKARLNVDGSKMVKHRDYDLTYAPVISWGIIRLLMTIAMIKQWPTRQIDYVLAFPQAPIEKELFLKIPKGYNIINDDKNQYALQINNNLYGQKQASRVWHEFLIKKLTKAKFVQSKHDPCVLFRKNIIYILYTDDSIITGPSTNEIDQAIHDIRATGLEITDEGEVTDFLGVRVTKHNNKIIFTQEHLINQILTDLKFQSNTKTKQTPSSNTILKRNAHSPPHDNSFHYRSIIGKLGYLEKGCRPDISYITHQCARFSIHPTMEHAKAIKWVAKYLKASKNKGIIIEPQPEQGLEVFVDADFAGSWDKNDTNNPDTARSRHGYIIRYAGCPVIWKSQLQTEFALSTTEAEYTGLSYAMRETIPMVNILREIEQHSDLPSKTPKVKCKVFEDNSGAIELATIHKYRPRTKHLNIRLHHFRDYVTKGLIEICKVDTKSQLADILTKPVMNPQFQNLRQQIMGW